MTNNLSYITKCHNIFMFGEWLKGELEKRKLSQYALAKMIGVTPTHINHIINQRRKPSAEMLKAISRGLRLPVEEVYRRAGILNPVSEKTKQTEELIYGYLINKTPNVFDKLILPQNLAGALERQPG